MSIIDCSVLYQLVIVTFSMIFIIVTTLLGFHIVQLSSQYFNIGHIFAGELRHMVNEMQRMYLSMMTIREHFVFILIVAFMLVFSAIYMLLLVMVMEMIIQWH